MKNNQCARCYPNNKTKEDIIWEKYVALKNKKDYQVVLCNRHTEEFFKVYPESIFKNSVKTYDSWRCKAITKEKNQCLNRKPDNNNFCGIHKRNKIKREIIKNGKAYQAVRSKWKLNFKKIFGSKT